MSIFQFRPQLLVTRYTEKPTVMFHQPPGLLTLPVELRLPIYRILLNKYNPHNTKAFLSISLVCHQIRDEILPLIFHDSIYFHSPEKLSKWTSRGDPRLLKLVDNISLHVFEEALVKLRNSLAESNEDPTEDFQSTKDWLTIRKPSQVEIPVSNPVRLASFCRTMWSGSSKIIRGNTRSFHQTKDTVGEKDAVTAAWDSFRAISNIRKIWILFRSSNTGSDRNSNLLEKEQQLVLNMIPAACPKMQEFTFFSISNLLPLSFLAHFQDLRLLRFSGYSKSSPEETLSILKSLNNLEAIIIYRYPEMYPKDNTIDTSSVHSYISFAPEVLENLQPLKSIHFSHMTSRIPSDHITVPMIQALRPHAESLRSLRIFTDFAVDGDVLLALLDFVASTKLKHLCLSMRIPRRFEKLDVQKYLPSTLSRKEVKLANPRGPNPGDLLEFGVNNFTI
jgi:hypothetical protein